MGKRELIDSTMFIDYILEMIHDVKEQGGFTEIFASDDEVVSTLIDIYRTLQERFAQNNIFDTFAASTGIEERADEIHKVEFGSYLFIDGFHDFARLFRNSSGSVFPSFEEIFNNYPDDPDREELYSECRLYQEIYRGFREADSRYRGKQDLPQGEALPG
jgi:ATP-dependent helicase/nuclease subunit B